VSVAEQDSLTYMAAENIYIQGDCETSKKNFAEYIQKFPAGKFLLNAHFYKAECHVKADELSQALESYNFIILQLRSTFTEPALLAASRINFHYLKDYQAALDNYTRLKGTAEVKANIQEARIGIMRCDVILEDYEKTIDASREVLADDKLSEEIQREAHYNIAGAFYELGRFVLAQEEYMEVAREVKSREGAESKYRVAEIWYIRKEYTKAAEVIFELIDLNTPHQYWMAKSFLLLSDVYLAQGDEFQASATLQSIIDYYEESGDGILDLAKRKKLDIDNRIREKQEKPAEEPEAEPAEQSDEAAGTLTDGNIIKTGT
jgi:TolA-binding protein